MHCLAASCSASVLLLAGGVSAATAPFRGETSPPLSCRYQPVFRPGTPVEGFAQRLAEGTTLGNGGGVGREVAFYVLKCERWPAGLVPLFQVELGGSLELRRRPLAGQENFTEPLCFALPPSDELSGSQLAGVWNCTGESPNRSKHVFNLELTSDAERVVGRFDQNTDYRFAQVVSGTCRSNALTLEITYAQERFLLTGRIQAGRIVGDWRQQGEADHGTWSGSRSEPAPSTPVGAATVPLYEWRRMADGVRSYHPEAAAGMEGWTRSSKPLCLVWMKPGLTTKE